MTPNQYILPTAISRRARWLDEFMQISGNFGADSARIENELQNEIMQEGSAAILDHLRLAGAIPEHYTHDSSEEKLYSKYTDILLAKVFSYIGLNSIVLSERADAADVEAVAADYSFVADAKAFRLSRTAKNQKDFKVEAMHGWKRGKPFAIVVCPIYQLPNRTSQIYQQAISRTVCILTYSHLAVLVCLVDTVSKSAAEGVLLNTLRATETLNPDKNAEFYWQRINETMLQSHAAVPQLWQNEKIANLESIVAAKQEALSALAQEHERILRMTHDQAIQALIKNNNLEGRHSVVSAVADSHILDIV